MDAAQWPQVGMAKSMEEMITSNGASQQQQQQQQQVLDSNGQRKVRPQKENNVNCPRCNSTNTKFCYYNNYSLTQPRYFCKTCRRYWTQGGSLRNVPVGGGSRKNKRSTPPSSSSPSSKFIPDLNPPTNFLIPPQNHLHHQNPSNKTHPHHGHDLNLSFPNSAILQPMELPKAESNNRCSPLTSTPVSALELLRTGISSSGLSSFTMPSDSNAIYSSSGFPNLQEMKPSLMGPSYGIGSLQDNTHHQETSGGVARLLFPFGDINKFPSHQNDATNTTRSDHQVDNHQSMKGSTSSQDHNHHQQGASGFWNGMLGGGTW